MQNSIVKGLMLFAIASLAGCAATGPTVEDPIVMPNDPQLLDERHLARTSSICMSRADLEATTAVSVSDPRADRR